MPVHQAHSVSIVIPAYNEQGRIQMALDTVLNAASTMKLDFEIIVVNDGCTDLTVAKVEQWLQRHAQARSLTTVIHNERNQGLGTSLRKGFDCSTKAYINWYPGDCSVTEDSLVEMWSAIGSAEIIIPYVRNVMERPLIRKVLSLTFTFLVNMLFGYRLRYYNGLLILPVGRFKSLKLSGRGHDLFCEIVVRCLRSNCSYREVPFTHKVETEKGAKAVSFRNVCNICRILFILIRDVYFRRSPSGN